MKKNINKNKDCAICYQIPMSLSPEGWRHLEEWHDNGHPNNEVNVTTTCNLDEKKCFCGDAFGKCPISPSDKTWEERCTNPKCHNVHAPSKYCLCDTKKVHENDDPEITDKDFEDMYVSLGKNETEKMERRFNIWLENRDDDFTLDIWDFRCLQDFIQQELTSATIKAKGELYNEFYRELRNNGCRTDMYVIKKYAERNGINLEEPNK